MFPRDGSVGALSRPLSGRSRVGSFAPRSRCGRLLPCVAAPVVLHAHQSDWGEGPRDAEPLHAAPGKGRGPQRPLSTVCAGADLVVPEWVRAFEGRPRGGFGRSGSAWQARR